MKVQTNQDGHYVIIQLVIKSYFLVRAIAQEKQNNIGCVYVVISGHKSRFFLFVHDKGSESC
jgi:hypothetical protein